jgi:hypothetical protein
MSGKVRAWVHGVVSALVGGAANAITVMVIDPVKFNLHDGWKNVLSAAAVSGVVAVAFYLRKFPTPDDVEVEK